MDKFYSDLFAKKTLVIEDNLSDNIKLFVEDINLKIKESLQEDEYVENLSLIYNNFDNMLVHIIKRDLSAMIYQLRSSIINRLKLEENYLRTAELIKIPDANTESHKTSIIFYIDFVTKTLKSLEEESDISVKSLNKLKVVFWNSLEPYQLLSSRYQRNIIEVYYPISEKIMSVKDRSFKKSH